MVNSKGGSVDGDLPDLPEDAVQAAAEDLPYKPIPRITNVNEVLTAGERSHIARARDNLFNALGEVMTPKTRNNIQSLHGILRKLSESFDKYNLDGWSKNGNHDFISSGVVSSLLNFAYYLGFQSQESDLKIDPAVQVTRYERQRDELIELQSRVQDSLATIENMLNQQRTEDDKNKLRALTDQLTSVDAKISGDFVLSHQQAEEYGLKEKQINTVLKTISDGLNSKFKKHKDQATAIANRILLKEGEDSAISSEEVRKKLNDGSIAAALGEKLPPYPNINGTEQLEDYTLMILEYNDRIQSFARQISGDNIEYYSIHGKLSLELESANNNEINLLKNQRREILEELFAYDQDKQQFVKEQLQDVADLLPTLIEVTTKIRNLADFGAEIQGAGKVTNDKERQDKLREVLSRLKIAQKSGGISIGGSDNRQRLPAPDRNDDSNAGS